MTTPQPHMDLRYPVGPIDNNPSPDSRARSVAAIRIFPEQFAALYAGLTEEQLEMPYREGGWTLRQLVHYVADSHVNAWVRVKRSLTENWPTIQPYDEKSWAETADVRGSVNASLAILAGLHARWAALLDSLTEEEWERGYTHPESGRHTLTQVAAMYSWHGRHHLAHATGLRDRMGW